MFDPRDPTPLIPLNTPRFNKKGVSVFIKRDDLIDSEISGNKWRKLKYNLIEAKNKGFETLLTFGGAFSNHIAATAAAANKNGFKSIGIIRGDELNIHSNTTLEKANMDGMKLIFVTRNQYKNRNDKKWLDELSRLHNAYIIPEGGSNTLALKGVSELIDEIDQPFDYLCSAVGTGGTLAGLISGLEYPQKALGIAALKGENYLEEEILKLLGSKSSGFELIHDYHFGGYAKFKPDLIEFIGNFNSVYGIPLDPIYTGKLMFGLFDMIEKDKFEPGTRIIAIHTGGLQGVDGFNAQHHLELAKD